MLPQYLPAEKRHEEALEGPEEGQSEVRDIMIDYIEPKQPGFRCEDDSGRKREKAGYDGGDRSGKPPRIPYPGDESLDEREG